jgi:acetyl esterase
MNYKPNPDYEEHFALNMSMGGEDAEESLAKIQANLLSYELGPDTTMEDRMVPGSNGVPDVKIRIIRPANLPKGAPVIMDIHGGGWIAGTVDIDNRRNIHLAESTPALVVAVEYRLTSATIRYPEPLKDCYVVYKWLLENAAEIGGDPKKIALHGTSAGGNLAEGLVLYLRDHGEQQPCLTVLNCPALSDRIYSSSYQMDAMAVSATGYSHYTFI